MCETASLSTCVGQSVDLATPPAGLLLASESPLGCRAVVTAHPAAGGSRLALRLWQIPPLLDRVVVFWESYGEGAPIGPPYNLGRTLTHEVGHYLGLNHTFNGGCDSGSCSSSGDLICDTSPQNSATFGCNGSSCSGTADPG